jgi:hypothetical protein
VGENRAVKRVSQTLSLKIIVKEAKMSQGKSRESIIPSGKAIGFMVVRGFGLFLSVSGMAGIAIVLGPLDRVVQDITFTPIFESKAYAFLLCLAMAVVGGALDFVANLGLKRIGEA